MVELTSYYNATIDLFSCADFVGSGQKIVNLYLQSNFLNRYEVIAAFLSLKNFWKKKLLFLKKKKAVVV